MPRRNILTERQRAALLYLPTDEPSLLKHYTLSDEDLEHINQRRRPENRLGFALQLCALRYPGRALTPGELIPHDVLAFIGAQLGLTGEALLAYAARRQTRQEHIEALRGMYGYRAFTGRGARDLKAWLEQEAEHATSNEDIARRYVEECRRTQTILPAIATIERLWADALVAAERQIETRIAQRLSDEVCGHLDALLSKHIDERLTRFVWLRQFEVGNNSAGANRLLDRLEFLKDTNLLANLVEGVPEHRVTRLRRQGESYFADGLRDLRDDPLLAILAVCSLEWQAAITDAIVETHDRIVGKTWREGQRLCTAHIENARSAVQQTVWSFRDLGAVLLEAKQDGASLEKAVESSLG